MRRFALLAALGSGRTAAARPLLERLRERRAARDAGTDMDAGSDLDGAAAGTGPVLPSGVLLERDLAYGSHPAQRLDLYRPAAASHAQVIVYVHGGGWRRGDKAMARMVRHKAPHWTGRGCLFLSINYRLLPEADVLTQAADVAAALAFVQGHAGAWGGDPARVILVGHSAGAHLVALMTAAPALAAAQGVRPWLASVALDSAALDMQALMSRRHHGFYDSVFGDDPAFWREASPMHRLQARPPVPMLLVCSAARDESCAQAQAFAAKARAFGGRVSVLEVALNHLEINDRLGLPGEYTDAVDAFIVGSGGAV